ncbi:MAG: hypothetical protein FVQ78_06485 [Solirubrobacterales bacterium]|nr:hypothetical protein [Solirubrobacterales bacterium]
MRPAAFLRLAATGALAALAVSGPGAGGLDIAHAQTEQDAASYIAVASQELLDGRFREVPTFEWDAAPGQTLRGRVLVTNQSKRSTAKVQVVPVSSARSENFGPAYAQAGEPLRPPASWVKMATRNQAIPPRRSRGFQFTVQVPANARTGNNVSGFSVTQTNQRTQEVQSAGDPLVITQRIRFALINDVRIPGPRKAALRLFDPKLELVGGKLVNVFKARNDGNVTLTDLKGWVAVLHEDSVAIRQRIDHGTIWPRTISQIRSERSELRPSAGDTFRVKAQVRYEGGVARLDETITIPADQGPKNQEAFPEDGGLPWWAWVAIALGAAALLAALAERRRRRRRPLDAERAFALLEHELGEIPWTGAPVSAIVVGGLPADARSKRRIAKALERRLRDSDRLCDLDAGRLLVVASDTGGSGATGLKDEIRRGLAGHELVAAESLRVGAATATEPTTAAQLVELASAADSGAYGPH